MVLEMPAGGSAAGRRFTAWRGEQRHGLHGGRGKPSGTGAPAGLSRRWPVALQQRARAQPARRGSCSRCAGGEPGARLGRAGRGAAQARKTKLTSVAHLAVREAAGPSCRKGRREKEIRGSKDISHELDDSASPCQAAVSCHISQSGKNVRVGATVVLNM